MADAWPRTMRELCEFLSIPSVSALPEYREHLDRASHWLVDKLKDLGFPEVRRIPTDGAAAVYGHWPRGDHLPTVLLYGHYDVQPADPEDLWDSPPFVPEERDGKLFARGASDDKGNLLIPLVCLEAQRRFEGGPPVNVKFLMEGEEEVGSPHLPQLLTSERDRLAADLVISADGHMWSRDVPSIILGSRGIAALEIEVRGPARDLHSGTHGGAVQNPIHALARILAGVWDEHGRIQVEGFYDQVQEPSTFERERLLEIPFSEEDYREELSVRELFGEIGYSTLERTMMRPTVEVNGIHGGFQGEGIKTVLPAVARAKLSCRLVPDQDPEDILHRLETHVHAHRPPGVHVQVRKFPGGSRAYRLPPDLPALQMTAKVLQHVYGRRPAWVRMGGTLPIAEHFRELLGAWLIFFGFGEPDNNIHAPNEFIRLASFRRGVEAYDRLLHEIAAHPEAIRSTESRTTGGASEGAPGGTSEGASEEDTR